MATVHHSTRSRGYLPHWENAGVVYFVTFRLADSLPQDLLDRLRTEREMIDRATVLATAKSRDAEEKPSQKINAILKKAEQSLDEGRGACYLRDPKIALLLASTLRHFHQKRYKLFAWCVMPNHVHVLFSPLGEHTLESVPHAWKSFSAHEANRLLRRTGPFWQREYFDHLVRHEASLQKFIEYIRDNPRKAGLKNWPHVEVKTQPFASAHPSSAGVSPAGFSNR